MPNQPFNIYAISVMLIFFMHDIEFKLMRFAWDLFGKFLKETHQFGVRERGASGCCWRHKSSLLPLSFLVWNCPNFLLLVWFTEVVCCPVLVMNGQLIFGCHQSMRFNHMIHNFTDFASSFLRFEDYASYLHFLQYFFLSVSMALVTYCAMYLLAR
jgi:hypothetical protein